MGAPDLRLGRYGLGARTGTTALNINDCVAAVWNPHATKDLNIILMTFARTANVVGCYAQRITTRGTPGSTVTGDIDNDFDRLLAPISGLELNLAAFSVQPTRAAPDYFRFMPTQNNPGPTQELYFGEDGLKIPAGTGLGLFQTTGTAGSGDISVVWDE